MTEETLLIKNQPSRFKDLKEIYESWNYDDFLIKVGLLQLEKQAC